MEKEITSTGKEMEALVGAISELKEVYTVGKENTFMAENAAAVASVALKLKPVVEKAATLRDAGNYTTPVKSRLGTCRFAFAFPSLRQECMKLTPPHSFQVWIKLSWNITSTKNQQATQP